MLKFNNSGEIKYHHVTTFRYHGFSTTIRSLCSYFFNRFTDNTDIYDTIN